MRGESRGCCLSAGWHAVFVRCGCQRSSISAPSPGLVGAGPDAVLSPPRGTFGILAQHGDDIGDEVRIDSVPARLERVVARGAPDESCRSRFAAALAHIADPVRDLRVAHVAGIQSQELKFRDETVHHPDVLRVFLDMHGCPPGPSTADPLGP